MKTILIRSVDPPSRVLVGEKAQHVFNYVPKEATRMVFVTDVNLHQTYRDLFKGYPVVEIGLGETNKTFRTLEHIFAEFVRLEVDRSWFIVAVGGGIVCDVAGFAASIFMRGLRFGFVSTSLLSQVDASVGGKNGVNFEGYKNMIGVFNQPEFVICDQEMLKTLDPVEFNAGFSEIIKAGAIRDAQLFQFMEENAEAAMNHHKETLEKMIHDAVQIKATVVENDEREKGERRVLNFGHTFAHSLEKQTGMLHGEAVSIGMVLASKLSVNMGYLDRKDSERIQQVLAAYHLPTRCPLPINKVITAMTKDKKREGSAIHLVLIDRIGHAFTEKVEINKLEELTHDLC